MKVYLSIVALALMVLSFRAGAAFYNCKIFPHSVLQQAFEAASALKRQILDYKSPYLTSLWHDARDDQRRFVERSRPHVPGHPATTQRQRCHAPDQGPLVTQDPAGIPRHSQTLLGPPFLAARLILDHRR